MTKAWDQGLGPGCGTRDRDHSAGPRLGRRACTQSADSWLRAQCSELRAMAQGSGHRARPQGPSPKTSPGRAQAISEVQGISRCCERQSNLFLKTGHTQVYKHMGLATLRRIEQCQAVQHWTSKPSPCVDILQVNTPLCSEDLNNVRPFSTRRQNDVPV